jgi:hypothetical protein
MNHRVCFLPCPDTRPSIPRGLPERRTRTAQTILLNDPNPPTQKVPESAAMGYPLNRNQYPQCISQMRVHARSAPNMWNENDTDPRDMARQPSSM